MGKSEIKDKISRLIVNEPSNWMDQVEYYEKNKSWLDKSAEIAVRILSTLRKLSLSQKDLADMIGVSPQYVNKVVRGQENLSLETICKIEKALQVSLAEVPANEDKQVISWINEPVLQYFRSNESILLGTGRTSYKTESLYGTFEEIFNA
jgi:transcriptional regulator with XRE-family HTH domain